MKQCSACKVDKPFAEFYADKRTPCGLKSQCKSCHTKGNLATRDIEKKRDANAAYQRRARAADLPAARARDREAAARRKKNERTAARALLNTAVKAGKVTRAAACESCGATVPLHGHHDDYSKPLQVRWLCTRCHGKEHRK